MPGIPIPEGGLVLVSSPFSLPERRPFSLPFSFPTPFSLPFSLLERRHWSVAMQRICPSTETKLRRLRRFPCVSQMAVSSR